MTLDEVNEFYGGVIPPGETLTPAETADAKPKRKGKASGRPRRPTGKRGDGPC